MSVFLRRSLCSSCLCLHTKPHISPFAIRQHSSSAHSPALKAVQAFEPRKARARDSTATSIGFQKNLKKPTKDRKPSVPRPNILEQTKVQDYLDYVASTNNSVTLEDIERCRPKTHALPGTLDYAEDYNAAMENLVRSFSKLQLGRFLELYGLKPPAKRTKWYYAETIIEGQWKWPSLTDIQKRQRDWSEMTTKGV
jgi:hypothetical protein